MLPITGQKNAAVSVIANTTADLRQKNIRYYHSWKIIKAAATIRAKPTT